MGIVSFVFPMNFGWNIRIIIVLGVTAATFFGLYLVQKYETSKTIKELNDIKTKHKALAAQFDHKRVQLQKYDVAFHDIETLIQQSILSTTKDKLKKLYEAFLTIEKKLIESEENDNV